MKDEVSQYTAISAGEESAVVRLVIQRPDDRHVLLARYESTIVEQESDGLYQYQQPSYWSFKGLPLKFVGNESSVAEAVVRTAYQRLGIHISEFEPLLKLFDRRVNPPKLGRLYLLVREWSGTLPDYIVNPNLLRGNEGLHEWTAPHYLESYVFHPEMVQALRAWGARQKKQKGAGA